MTFSKVGGGSASAFTVGDSWQLEITGPPNQPVWVAANGAAPVQLGTTDANGNFSDSKQIGPGDTGNWGENWYVGPDVATGVYVGSLSFVVNAAAPATPPAPTPPPPIPPPSGNQNLTSPQFLNLLTGSSGLNIAGYNVPWWMVAGVGVGAIVAFTGRRR